MVADAGVDRYRQRPRAARAHGSLWVHRNLLGIESLDAEALRSVNKRPNQIDKYRDAVQRLHDLGICVMAGFISGFDSQTPESIVMTADRLNEMEFDVPFLSILTPFRGTPLYDELRAQERLLEDRGWPHYNGYNVAFRPKRMSPRRSSMRTAISGAEPSALASPSSGCTVAQGSSARED